ncbi:MAG: 5-formyltetrahydrofolate cyclo-ligase [Candidatus Omnitrophica bacterium]|nr:5-formyltetrahydrofolate cyclo-ligase [Candidatus Omnitrophota bacterium]MCM8831294.1 5-formyltetrahydrofolate cyclo-ligase [Candidatus Omnitrophota bacterium]
MKGILNTQSKKDIRNFFRQKLFSLTEEQIKRRSENVTKNFLALPIYNNAKVIMGYYPLKGEVDVLGILKKAIFSKKIVCFPVIDLKQKKLLPYCVEKIDDNFVCGPFGIKQPDIQKSKKINIEQIDIVIVPALAFDYQKNRLGRGAGFYDRFLSNIKPPTKKIGICFDFQLLESLPQDTRYDQKVDIILTENFII